ncbi:hypothetical protein BDV28DRAFT_146729 [Aspergillus coremiiformis]|uniref:Uncharacterized protein n=1 Tax=Aspergillus coremiiformis TaxID=138285 RepID=A0A5N6ZAX7_9EURO|nr:hypothetical protein BDV28DRAFT_146729 [Aspergillus coremiiformis]
MVGFHLEVKLYTLTMHPEPCTHIDLSLWLNVEDPAVEYTMSAEMRETYRRLYKDTGKRQRLIKNARRRSTKNHTSESSELGSNSSLLPRTDIDYLANNGAKLEKTIQTGPIVVTRLKDALELFIGAENRSRAKIEALK